jgi:hypothetical protein
MSSTNLQSSVLLRKEADASLPPRDEMSEELQKAISAMTEARRTPFVRNKIRENAFGFLSGKPAR